MNPTDSGPRTAATVAEEVRTGFERRSLAALDRLDEARAALVDGDFQRAAAVSGQARDHIAVLASAEHGLGSFAHLRLVLAGDLQGLYEQAPDGAPLVVFQWGTVEAVSRLDDQAHHPGHGHVAVRFAGNDEDTIFCERQEILVDAKADSPHGG